MTSGWKYESNRHKLARQGIKTKTIDGTKDWQVIFDESQKYDKLNTELYNQYQTLESQITDDYMNGKLTKEEYRYHKDQAWNYYLQEKHKLNDTVKKKQLRAWNKLQQKMN
jgi:hypothetical protein